jgi:hypothetical protein
MELSDQQIHKILESYKKKRMRENKYYHETSKNKEEFILKNRARAKAHYEKNKENKIKKYQDNKELVSAKNLFNYYRKKDNVDKFIEKHENKYNLLKSKNIIE